MTGATVRSEDEFETAIAAAAYAIAFLEAEGSRDHEKPTEGLKASPTKTKSEKEDSMKKPTDSIKISKWLSDKYANKESITAGEKTARRSTLKQKMQEDSADWKMPKKAMGTTPTVKKTPTFSDRYLNDTNIPHRSPEKAMETTPTIKKTPTFSDTYLNDTGNKRFESAHDMRAGKHEGFWNQNNTKSRKQESEADSWETEEMIRIRKWHDKTKLTILRWENEKKLRARCRFKEKESELEWRRRRALQEYRNEMSLTDKIAGGARVISDERKINDEMKIKEKAERIRSTGEFPHKWLCI